jgi:hypothetical protein
MSELTADKRLAQAGSILQALEAALGLTGYRGALWAARELIEDAQEGYALALQEARHGR